METLLQYENTLADLRNENEILREKLLNASKNVQNESVNEKYLTLIRNDVTMSLSNMQGMMEGINDLEERLKNKSLELRDSTQNFESRERALEEEIETLQKSVAEKVSVIENLQLLNEKNEDEETSETEIG